MPNKRSTTLIGFICIGAAINGALAAHTDIYVHPILTDATAAITQAIDKASQLTTDSATIHLAPESIYNLSKLQATRCRYHISNTTSAEENPDPTKHIGILLKHIRHITIDGHGATLMTHGEMTPWVIDSCESVTLTNLIIDASDPSVTEMTVTAITDSTITCRPHPTSHYIIRDGKLYWRGEGWCFTDGIAQQYSPESGFSLRCPSPIADAINIRELPDDMIELTLGYKPKATPGDVFQMRHSLRTEVAGFINRSKNVRLENIKFRFMGNFGIVAQYSENITYHRIDCEPDNQSGRTCSGFADFMQMSGCKGLVNITECNFAGSHDDPINIHGTHLRVIEFPTVNSAIVRFMHPQTFGFQAFTTDDTVDFINQQTLNVEASARVISCQILNDYDQLITFDSDLPNKIRTITELAVENATWTPDVTISHNRFTLTPTRGILVTTRGRVQITDNRFIKMPMSAILISDDAKNWYESGFVRDVLISNNSFEQCQSPVILI